MIQANTGVGSLDDGNSILLAAGVQIAGYLIGRNCWVFFQLALEDAVLGDGLFLVGTLTLLVYIDILIVPHLLHFC